MTRIRKPPYLTPSSERFTVGDWVLITDESSEPLTDLFPIWEPAVSIRAFVPIKADILGILEDCNLGLDAHLRLGAVWSSSGTVLRGRGDLIDLNLSDGVEEMKLGVQVEGIKLAKSIDVSLQLILTVPSSQSKPFAPKIPGSILWQSEPRRVLLEGEGARFPVEVMDFSQSYSPYPDDAAWVLHWDPSDLHQTILGDVRLYFNTKHERVIRAVSNNKPEDFDLREAIRFDVARSLIYGALDNDEFVENPDGFEDGSVGSAVRNMLHLYFPNMTIPKIQLDSVQQQTFEPKLQAKLRAFWLED